MADRRGKTVRLRLSVLAILGFKIECFGSKLVESLLAVLKSISKFTDATQKPLTVTQILRGVFSTI